MADLRFQSLHLEGLPRREDFRAARARLEASCGLRTLSGDLSDPSPIDPGDGATAVFDIALGQRYFVQDGEKLHPLLIGVNSIGRLPDNHVVIRDEHVSRRHCAVIIHRSGRCEVHDVASKNGTVLNGHKIAGPTNLKPGDQLLLCNRRLVFLTGQIGPAPSPAPAAGSD
jgi:hypothetical protein